MLESLEWGLGAFGVTNPAISTTRKGQPGFLSTSAYGVGIFPVRAVTLIMKSYHLELL
jgi:hypothetical protein